jgi:[acyl-carrier-protein] S-malonyltransferase
MRAAIFPEQVVHAPGMADGLSELQPRVFKEASETLGVDMSELCLQGRSGKADLSSTRWAQPAIVTASVAAALTLQERGVVFDAVAGHSLGEYSALVAAGSLSVSDGVRLVALRAEAMDKAAASSPGGMAALLGLDRGVIDDLCDEHGVVVAGDNAPGQVVVSGPHEAIDRVLAAAKALKGKGTKLNVAGAFHSPAMLDAVDDLSRALDEVPIAVPLVAYWSPTTATRLTDTTHIRDALLAQLTGPVLWRQTITHLVDDGATGFFDVGPGHVVANMVKRIAPQVQIEAGVVHADG